MEMAKGRGASQKRGQGGLAGRRGLARKKSRGISLLGTSWKDRASRWVFAN